MTDNTEWLMRPVIAGMCKYESLLDGIGLEHIARMNEALDVQQENELRYHESQK